MNALLSITPKLAIDLLGYLGMAVVLVSFLMTKQKLLRAVNMLGGLISLVYAILSHQSPTAVLNLSLVTINGIYLIREFRNDKKFSEENKVIESDSKNEEQKEENI